MIILGGILERIMFDNLYLFEEKYNTLEKENKRLQNIIGDLVEDYAKLYDEHEKLKEDLNKHENK